MTTYNDCWATNQVEYSLFSKNTFNASMVLAGRSGQNEAGEINYRCPLNSACLMLLITALSSETSLKPIRRQLAEDKQGRIMVSLVEVSRDVIVLTESKVRSAT